MFCSKCGKEVLDGAQFCVNCGAKIESNADAAKVVETVAVEPVVNEPAVSEPVVATVADKFIGAFKDPLFLTGCILISVSVLSFRLINVLLTIFLWIIFAAAKNGKCDYDKMRCVSGTVYAAKVLAWIGVGICFFFGFIFAIAGSALGVIGTQIIDEFMSTVSSKLPLNIGVDLLGLGLNIIFVVAAVSMIIAAVIILLMNIFVLKPFHKLAKSMYESVQNNILQLERVSYARKWMMALGIICAIGALGSIYSFTAFLASGGKAAALIVFSIWTKKFFE